MAGTRSSSELMTLERYRVSLNNVEIQPDIAATMAEYGYGTSEISEGKALLAKTRETYESNQQETDEASTAYLNFSTQKQKLEKRYSSLRKKAKVVFRKDALMLNKLDVSGEMPTAYINWLEGIRKYLAVVMADAQVKTQLARLKVSDDELQQCNDDLKSLEQLRALYLKEKGESQNATKVKDAQFAEIDDWMREFYAVAKIALEDQPQLLESLGKVVKG